MLRLKGECAALQGFCCRSWFVCLVVRVLCFVSFVGGWWSVGGRWLVVVGWLVVFGRRAVLLVPVVTALDE